MKHLLAVAVLVVLLLFLITRKVSPDPYISDEAEFIRQSNDVLFYRHWHGPLYHFILIPVSLLGINEHGVRSAMLVISALTLLAIYFGCLWFLPGLSGSLAAFLGSPIEWAVVAIALVLYRGRSARKEHRFACPIVIFSILMLAATGRVLSGSARYSLPFMPALDLFATLILAPVLTSLRKPVAFGIAGAIAAGLFAIYRVSIHTQKPDLHSQQVLDHIRQASLMDKTLLVPQSNLPMIHYYFPATRLRGYYTAQPTPADLEGLASDVIL
jgi:hypothetical protein